MDISLWLVRAASGPHNSAAQARARIQFIGACAGVDDSRRLIDDSHDVRAEGGRADSSQIHWATQSGEERLAPAQDNRMNDQPILVDETGSNEALSEPGAAMRKDEFARLFFQSSDFLREIAACHHGFSPRTSGPPLSA